MRRKILLQAILEEEQDKCFVDKVCELLLQRNVERDLMKLKEQKKEQFNKDKVKIRDQKEDIRKLKIKLLKQSTAKGKVKLKKRQEKLKRKQQNFKKNYPLEHMTLDEVRAHQKRIQFFPWPNYVRLKGQLRVYYRGTNREAVSI